MSTETIETTTPDTAAVALRSLERLVGRWRISGPDVQGEVRYEWMDGGGFLVQHVDLDQGGTPGRGVEYIGYDKDTGKLRSHYFGGDGEILEYVYRIDGDDLTIWFGDVDSPARFDGRFSADGRSNSGAWQWPGGGYESTMVRAD